MKQLEAESTSVHEVYFLLAVCLKALLAQWSNGSGTSFGREVDCLLDMVNKEKHHHTVDIFQEYYGAVVKSGAAVPKERL